MALNDTITALGNSIINFVDKKTPIATNNTVGMVKPDGNTISIDTNGVISSNGGGLYKPFDVVMKDHILSFEESKGLVAFGDYAYKTGSVGTRYGYPEFYERCIKEYHESSSYEQLTTRNYRSLVEGDGDDSLCFIKEDYDNNIFTASRFLGGDSSQAKGLSIDSAFLPSSLHSSYYDSHRIYEIEIKTGDDVTTQQCIIGCGDFQFAVMIKSSRLLYYSSSNGSSWNEANAKTGYTKIQPNTTYKLVLDIGRSFTVKLNDNLDYASSEIVGNGYLSVVVGVHPKKDDTYIYPFLGTINLATLSLYVSLVNNYVEEYKTTKAYNKIWLKKHSNGHKFYDISDVSEIDNLYNKLGMTWLYGIDTTNERVRMPRNDGYFMCGTKVGAMVQAGLPNIVGTTQNTSGHSQNTGAFKFEKTIPGNDGNGKDALVGFDASRCSNLYGNSDTVQTDAVKLMGYICVGNTETEVANIEVINVTTSENDTVPLFTGQYFDFKPNNISWLKAGTVQPKSGTIYETAYNELVKCLNTVDNVYNIKVVDVADMVEGVDYSLYWKVDQVNMTFTTPSKWGLVSDYTEDVYLYFKVGNAVQNTEIIDVGTLTETVNNKIDINSKYVDGQWVSKTKTLSTTTAIGTYTIDLSDYLPNDNYNYEVKVAILVNRTSSGRALMFLSSSIIPKFNFTASGSACTPNTGTADIAVGVDRKLTMIIEINNFGSVSLNAIAYRRIGTNV